MKKEDMGIGLSILATLLSVVISEAMPNLFLKLLFIITFSLEVILLLNFLNSKNNDSENTRSSNTKKKIILYILGIVIVIMLILPCISTGSLDNYFISIKEFLHIENEEKNKQVMYNISEEISEINDNILKLHQNFSEYQFFKSKEDQQQIDLILDDILTLNEEKEGETPIFSDLKDNKHSLELFYKMKLSNKSYYYYNIIKAFEAYGIDCEKFSINEYVLALWDVESLYALYNMRKSLENDLANNTFYEENCLSYDEFKMNMSEYSDTFSYDDWYLPYRNKTVSEIMESLDSVIISFYKKFYMNFNKNME